MTDFVPKSLDLGNVAALLQNGAPARNLMFQGVAGRRPAMLSGWAGAEERRINDILGNAFADNDAVNQQLEQLALGEQYTNQMKSRNTLAGVAAGQLPPSARAEMLGIEPINDLFINPEQSYKNIGMSDSANLEDIIAGTAKTKQETDLMPFDSQTKRLAAANSGSDNNGVKVTENYDVNGKLYGTSVTSSGASAKGKVPGQTTTAKPTPLPTPGNSSSKMLLDSMISSVPDGEMMIFPFTDSDGSSATLRVTNNGGKFTVDFGEGPVEYEPDQ